MKNFEPRSYSINDFKEWTERKELVLSPKFQRRPVWSEKARSFLIDTIIRGKPIPKIYMRHDIDPLTRRSIREIVDGQQRLRAILDFLQDGFKISKIHNEQFGGLFYSQLPKDVQTEILKYEISVDILSGVTDADVLDIFARLNTYTVKLNRQELLNSKYFGDFKQTVYSLGYEFHKFFVDNSILTEKEISRMGEAELVSELIIAMIDNIQSKKVIESYYRKYDDKFLYKNRIEKEFKQCIDLIAEIFGTELESSNFSSKHLFYSFFSAIYDIIFGLTNTNIKRYEIKSSSYAKIRSIINEIDNILNSDKLNEKYSKFIDSCIRHTSDLSSRKIRHAFIVNKLIGGLRG